MINQVNFQGPKIGQPTFGASCRQAVSQGMAGANDNISSSEREETFCTCFWNSVLWPVKILGAIVTSVTNFIFHILCCCCKCRETETGTNYKQVKDSLIDLQNAFKSENEKEIKGIFDKLEQNGTAMEEFQEFLKFQLAQGADKKEQETWLAVPGNVASLDLAGKIADPITNKVAIQGAIQAFIAKIMR